MSEERGYGYSGWNEWIWIIFIIIIIFLLFPGIFGGYGYKE